jgi:hypothetical protein
MRTKIATFKSLQTQPHLIEITKCESPHVFESFFAIVRLIQFEDSVNIANGLPVTECHERLAASPRYYVILFPVYGAEANSANDTCESGNSKKEDNLSQIDTRSQRKIEGEV